MDYKTVEWVMACVTSVSFAVLVNGSPSFFFHGSRGLRQGFPLSPLLFLLIIEGLSRTISLDKDCGDIRGVRVSNNHSLTHLLFVDGVLLFGMNCALEWRRYHQIFKDFCDATGMEINLNKSCFLSLEDEMDLEIHTLFPIEHKRIDEGIKYLGFQLKPNGYNKSDWSWLIERVEKKIGMWCFRWLTLGGRLTLIKTILESIPVYWMTLYKIPKSVLNFLRGLATSYLWSGNNSHDKIHLTRWSVIARPRSMGGWGLKDLETFGRALRMKTMWRFLTTDTIWSQI